MPANYVTRLSLPVVTLCHLVAASFAYRNFFVGRLPLAVSGQFSDFGGARGPRQRRHTATRAPAPQYYQRNRKTPRLAFEHHVVCQ